ncbi:Outer membrane receptor proteins, mostly Fe transport [Parasphingorhabdus marina DSM 22363]|uniref:Outer membrane receptor proteins, mostly Fe transport n=1 Tax=Parasphingorhabdus marina DSM 22363 TaxID=1123272 RepID=A0A1N6D1E5_9SPHN|nr:TonB-dependent receptor [Parasphingorhabdus marina]SIN64605.1 Outer membrane receptor proteins, mostly Fe transport [Parasphingorhabdus marina DSM 22363]
MRRKQAVRFCSSISTVALMLAAQPVLAQVAEGDAADADDSNIIVVTATKREQTLQEVPVAVTVTDALTIERAGITDLTSLQSVVPSLQVRTRQNAVATNFFIRGFGNGANADGIEPSVGVFIDGVYRSRSGAAISDLPNIQRVEVLRGPQSTLFGKNASAGVVSVVTKEPEYQFGGSAEISYGNFDLIRGKAYVNVPIADDLAALAISGSFNQRDGYIRNLFNDTDLNNVDRWAIQGDLLIEPADNVKLRLKADYDEIDEVCCMGLNIEPGVGGLLIPAIGGSIVPADPFSYTAFADVQPGQEISNLGISLKADVDFDTFALTSITSYRRNESFTSVDTDFSSAAVFGVSPSDREYKTFTQELRLTSNTDGFLDWMIGGFYFHETIDIESQVIFGPDGRAFFDTLLAGVSPTILSDVETALALPVGTFFANGTGSFESFDQSNDSFSIFGQLDFNITDELTVTAGANYTYDKKRVELMSRLPLDPFSNTDLSPLFAQPQPLPAFAGFLQGLQAAFLPGLIAIPNANETGRSSDDKITWTARVAYEITPEFNVYASVATGFKATSWSLSRDTRPGTRFATPEDVIVYEVGAKADLGSLVVNFAAFDQTIEDFQSTVFTGTGFAFLNADEQSVKGFELDATIRPADPFVFTFAYTYLDPLFDSFPNFAAGVDLSGTRPAGIPSHTISASATYNHEFANGWKGFLRTDYQHESRVRVENNTGAISRTVNEVNVAAGLEFGNGLSVNFWGRNIFDDEYITGAFPVAVQDGTIAGYPNQPATYGGTIRFEF